MFFVPGLASSKFLINVRCFYYQCYQIVAGVVEEVKIELNLKEWVRQG